MADFINFFKTMNDDIPIFIYLLLEHDHRRNHMRLVRYHLRDSQNAFEMSNTNFISYFRLNKCMVLQLINTLQPHAVEEMRSTRIPFHLRVLATLYFLSNGSYQKPIGGFSYISCSQPVISRVIFEISQLITAHFMPIHVKFPTNRDAKTSIKEGFFFKYNLRGIIGAVDGTHIEIIAPSEHDDNHPPFVYINRKGKHSINVMLICDSNNIITAVNARYPGSVHDAAVWQMSNIKNYLRENYESGDRNSFLLGDSGYGLEPWLLTPYLQYAQGSPEERYNLKHKTARNVIERTNGILKARFRCLSRHRVLHYHPAKAAYIIYSCVVLHNIAVKARLELAEHDIEVEQVDVEDDIEPLLVNMPVADNLLNAGRRRRNLYVQENML